MAIHNMTDPRAWLGVLVRISAEQLAVTNQQEPTTVEAAVAIVVEPTTTH